MDTENLYGDDDDDLNAISLEKIKADFSCLDDGLDGSQKGSRWLPGKRSH